VGGGKKGSGIGKRERAQLYGICKRREVGGGNYCPLMGN